MNFVNMWKDWRDPSRLLPTQVFEVDITKAPTFPPAQQYNESFGVTDLSRRNTEAWKKYMEDYTEEFNRTKFMTRGERILEKTKTYLIGAMEYADGRGWRDDMTEFLDSRGVVVFNPYKKSFINAPEENEKTIVDLTGMMENNDYEIVEKRMKEVRAFDLSMVDRSDFIICYINPKVPTFGTMEELSWAARLKRPVFIVVDGGKSKTPLWVMGMFPHKYIYNSFDEVREMLRSIDDGEKVIDSDRWRLFRPELR